MIDVDEWAEIRHLHFAEKVGIREIVKRTGVARNTVRAALRSAEAPRYARPRRPSAVDAFEPRIRGLLAEHPRMPATVIAERLGWTRSKSLIRHRVAQLRPEYAPQDPYQRTEYEPGELAQWDFWFPDVDIPVEGGDIARFPVWVGVSGYSRWIVGQMIPSRESCDLLGAHWECLQRLGGVPKAGVYDNEGAIGRHVGTRVRLAAGFARFRGLLGMKAIVLRPAFPEGKGLVERANEYFETSFLPGRTFTSVADFNEQFTRWLEKANTRVHRILRCRPSDRIAEDRAAMMALPPIQIDVRWHQAMRIRRDHYVRFGTCDYSVHPRAIGRMAEVTVDLRTVKVTLQGEVVAEHSRSLAPHRTITDPVHVAARRRTHAGQQGVTANSGEVEERDLSIYDRVLGVAS